MKNKIAFYTLGCKVNTYETDSLRELFKKNNYDVTNFDALADIYVINTCTVTNLSSRKSRQMLRRAKKNNPEAIVVAIGCYSQENPKVLQEMPEVDMILGNNNKKELLQLINDYTGETTTEVIEIEEQKQFEMLEVNNPTEHTRAFIKIQDGCNEFCSYCIIPYVRGRIRSKSYDETLKEVKALAKNKYKEIVLTGIHVTSYGKDLERDVDLIDMVQAVSEVEGIERVRLGSLEPTFLTADNILRLKAIQKFAPQFHLSMQSGSDSVLKRMNRNYTTKEYYSVVEKIREHFDRPAITTDIIVGFPGETEEEFMETYEFVKKVKFSEAHVFRYSDRDGTQASKMKEKIDGNISAERSQKLRGILEVLKQTYQRDFIGGMLPVLFEQYDEESAQMNGLTPNYLRVYVKTNKDYTNEIKNVKIKEISEESLIGEIVE